MEPKDPAPPATPTLDKLAGIPAGIARDLFYKINERAIARESLMIQRIEQAAHVSEQEARVHWAERLKMPELATYWSKDPTSADIYRTIHNAAINRQLAEYESLKGTGKTQPAPSTLPLARPADDDSDNDNPPPAAA